MHITQCRVGLSVVVAGLTLRALAQEPVPDYSRGFASFYALALPDVKDATYVRLDKQTARQQDVFRRYGEQGPDIGAAWLIKRLGEDGGELLVGGINRLTVISKRQWQDEQEARIKAAAAAQADGGTIVMHSDEDMQENRRLPGSFEPADVQADATRLVDFLAAAESEGRGGSDALQRQSGTIFLLAIHLHRSGATNEANRAAHLLFQKAGGQQAVIESALSQLADSQYADLYRAFIANRDWQALHSGIDALAKRFARGWQRRDAVLQAAGMMAPRLAGAPAPLQAEGLSETDQALTAELATATTIPRQAAQALQHYSQSLWILPGTTPRGISSAAKAETNVLDRIKARGMESIPLLIALLDDPYPTVIDNPSGNVNSFTQNSYYYYSSGSRSPQQQARMMAQRTAQYYASLPRPLTRGEIAAALLQQVVPRSQDAFRQMQMEDDGENSMAALRAAATTWYEANKTKRGLELALVYLEDDADEYADAQNAVLMYIAREGGTNEQAIVEQKLLARDPVQGASMAMQYAQIRGEAVRPFVETYITHLKTPAAAADPADGEDGDAALFIRSSGRGTGGNEAWTKQMIKQFETLLENATLADLVESLVSGEKKPNAVSQVLHRAIAGETPSKAVELLLDGAIRAKDVTTTMTLIGMIQTIPYSRQARAAYGGIPEPETAKLEMPAPAEHRERWLKLLGDSRMASEEEAAMWGASAREQYTVAAITAYAIEALSATAREGVTGYYGHRAESYTLLGARLVPLMIQRATLLVEGKDESALPPMPDAANVSPEARRALAEKLIAMDAPTALRETLDGLSMDATLAVMEEVDENEPLRNHLAPLARIINTVTIEVGDEALKARFEALKGTPFKRKTGEQLFEAIKQLSPGGQPAIEATAQRMPGFDGFTILIREVGKGRSMRAYMDYSHSGVKTPMLVGMLYGEDEHANGRWKLEPVATEPTPADGAKATPSAAETRRQKLIEMMAASGQEIPPEAIAMLEQMSEADLEEMDIDEDDIFDEDENTRFWESLDRICGEKANPASHIMLTFASTAPSLDGDENENEDEDDGIYYDNMIYDL